MDSHLHGNDNVVAKFCCLLWSWDYIYTLFPPVSVHDLLPSKQGPQVDPVLGDRPGGDHLEAQFVVLQVLPQSGGDGGLNLGGDICFYGFVHQRILGLLWLLDCHPEVS